MVHEHIEDETPYNNEFIDKIVQLDETHNLDFKESPTSKNLIEKLFAMANQQGGDIYVGITDKKPRQIKNVIFEKLFLWGMI